MVLTLIILIIISIGIIIFFLTKKKKIITVEKYVPTQIVLKPSDSELLRLINETRIKNGLNVLVGEELLTHIASNHTNYMFSIGYVTHDGFEDRVKETKTKLVCENVAYNYSSPAGVFNAYMKSEPHRYNILNKSVTHIGICSNNKYNTCLFAKYQ